MRLRFDQRLFLSYLLLISLLVVPGIAGTQWLVRRNLLESVRTELARELVLARAFFEASTHLSPDAVAAQLAELSGRRVTIIDRTGRVSGESSPTPLSQVGNHLLRPEVQAALRGEFGAAVRESETVREELLYMAIPSSREGVLRFAVPISEIDRSIWRIHRAVLGVGTLALLLAAIFSAGFSRGITRPLRRLVEEAREMAAGNLARRPASRRDDEIGDLSLALDTLAGELQRRIGQLEAERAESQTLIDSMEEGVIALDPMGRVRRANPAAIRMFSLGSEPAGLAAESVDRRPDFLRMVSRVLGGERLAAAELSISGNSLLATAHPLPDGGAVLVFLDVSELRRLEGVRRDFVANVSHELKTPLTAIRGYSETLQDPDLPAELRERFTSVIQANAERLQHIVDDLLDLSRIESGNWNIDPSPVKLADAAREAWNAQARIAEEGGIRFVNEIPVGERVMADPVALHQVFTNLFSNAIRYTPDGGTVSVRSSRIVPDGAETVQIEVEDSGAGIPATHLSRVFERFYRADPARSRSEGGTGLGLAIVKHLVESHGGTVSATSAIGEGTTFRFTLPAAGSSHASH